MRKLNFALVGTGMIAAHHMAAMDYVDGAVATGVYGAIPEQAKAFGEKYGLKVFDTYEDLLADETIDFITICTPSGTHAEKFKYKIREKRVKISCCHKALMVN